MKYFTPQKNVFQKGNSTDYAVIKSINQIYSNLENEELTACVFIDLFKAFLIKKGHWRSLV